MCKCTLRLCEDTEEVCRNTFYLCKNAEEMCRSTLALSKNTEKDVEIHLVFEKLHLQVVTLLLLAVVKFT